MTLRRRRRVGGRRHLVRAALTAGLGLAVVLVAGVPVSGSPLAGMGPAAAAATTVTATTVTAAAVTVAAAPTVACSRAKGTHVALVVDFDAGVERVCEAISSGDDEAEALAVMSSALGWPAPRYAASGLLCAIDDRPSSGCGTPVGTGYAYWSSWQGTGSWSYSSGDPSTTTVAAGTTIGWRFQPHGRGGPTDPPPPAPSSPSKVCPGTTPGVEAPLSCASPAPAASDPPPTTSPPTSTTDPPTSTSQPAGPPPASSAASTPPATSSPTSTPATPTPATSTPAAVGGRAGSRPGPGSDRAGRGGSTSPTRARPAASGTAPPPAGPGPDVHGGTGAGAVRAGRGRLAAAPVASRSGSSNGGVVPYLVVAGALAGLAGAVVIGRRRAARTAS